MVIEFNHSFHPGREQYGVPVKVREWIKNNPRATPFAQREDLYKAIEKGEIQEVKDRFLSVPHIHYWWRKLYKEKTYLSKDPWENAAHILEQHPMVHLFFVSLILDE